MKKIIVVCGAYPDQGKGTLAAALSYVINQSGNLSLPFKFDGYLNISSGEMNMLSKNSKIVYQGEEVFVLEDGFETDADSGTYERFVGKNLGSWHVISGGQLTMQTILDNTIESGKIQNHLDVIKKCEDWIIGSLQRVDIPVIEVGGTVGDAEQEMFFRALKRVSKSKGIPYKLILLGPYMKTINDTDPSSLLSFRTKIIRMALEYLEEKGLMADVAACNSPDGQFGKVDIEYVSRSFNYLNGKVLNLGWRSNIYEKTEDALAILNKIDPEMVKDFKPGRIEKYVESCKKAQREISIGILGDTVSNDTYKSIMEGLEHASYSLGMRPKIEWLAGKPSSMYDIYVVTDGAGYQIIKDMKVKSLLAIGEAFASYAASLGSVEKVSENLKELHGAEEVRFGMPELWTTSWAEHKRTLRFRHIMGIKSIRKANGKFADGLTLDFATSLDGRIVGIKMVSNSIVHTAIAAHPEFDSKPEMPSEILLKHIADTLEISKENIVGDILEKQGK
ncbi:MAG: hypothetical protein ACP5RT_02655 [Candidatus Micrarchaeia archaeon]